MCLPVSQFVTPPRSEEVELARRGKEKKHTKKKATQKAKLSAVDSVSKLKASRCCQTLGASLETLARPRRANRGDGPDQNGNGVALSEQPIHRPRQTPTL